MWGNCFAQGVCEMLGQTSQVISHAQTRKKFFFINIFQETALEVAQRRGDSQIHVVDVLSICCGFALMINSNSTFIKLRGCLTNVLC